MNNYQKLRHIWQKSQAYFLILGGTGTRMVAALIYFLLLVNILPLEDYGLFVSILASALIISNGSTFGFLAPTFRAQTEESKEAANYAGGLILYAILWMPVTLTMAYGLYLIFFAHYTSLDIVLSIIVAEAILMRLLDAIYHLNIARNRYGIAALVNISSILPRLIAIVLFSNIADQTLSNWSSYFLQANICALLIACFFIPKMEISFSLSSFRDGLKEAFTQEGVNFVQSIQMELDKLLVLTFAGPAAAGIYSLSMRIIYVINEPIRSIFPLVAKFFIKDTKRIRSLANQLKLEIGLILSSSLAYGCLIVILNIKPDLLGDNIEAGYHFFAMLPMVFALKLVPEYHKTVLYGAKLLPKAFAIALLLTLTKSVIIYLIASNMTFANEWFLPLNLLYIVLYIQSLWATWGWAMNEHPKTIAAE
ncbi:MAG: oligosaccharide flippase family protein [Cohaesibacter sp.]|nr:oligosaccharide flippase family protein [Cohaesibacter sp.]